MMHLLPIYRRAFKLAVGIAALALVSVLFERLAPLDKFAVAQSSTVAFATVLDALALIFCVAALVLGAFGRTAIAQSLSYVSSLFPATILLGVAHVFHMYRPSIELGARTLLSPAIVNPASQAMLASALLILVWIPSRKPDRPVDRIGMLVGSLLLALGVLAATCVLRAPPAPLADQADSAAMGLLVGAAILTLAHAAACVMFARRMRAVQPYPVAELLTASGVLLVGALAMLAGASAILVAGLKATGYFFVLRAALREAAGRSHAHLRRARKRMHSAEERFTLAVSAAGIWDYNFATGEEYLSPRFKQMLGYSDDELQNERKVWLHLLHPDDREPTLATQAQQLRCGRPPDVLQSRGRAVMGAPAQAA